MIVMEVGMVGRILEVQFKDFPEVFVTHFDKSVASSEVLRNFFAFDIGHGQNRHKECSGVVVFVATISPVLLIRHGLVGESVEAIKEELVEVVQRASLETGWPFRSSGNFSGDLITFECFGQEVCRPGKNAIEVQNYRLLGILQDGLHPPSFPSFPRSISSAGFLSPNFGRWHRSRGSLFLRPIRKLQNYVFARPSSLSCSSRMRCCACRCMYGSR